jgi:hypothetical protein
VTVGDNLTMTDTPGPMTPGRRRSPIASPKPLFSLLALLAFLAVIVVVLVTGYGDHAMFWPLVATSIPSLVAAIASETAVRDIRNGTVVEKARQGASQAIEEKVADKVHEGAIRAIADTGVMTRTGPVATVQLEALRALLEDVKRTTASTAEAVTDVRSAVADQDARAADNGTT